MSKYLIEVSDGDIVSCKTYEPYKFESSQIEASAIYKYIDKAIRYANNNYGVSNEETSILSISDLRTIAEYFDE